ncbi:serine hydrolase domain-containing protein [Mucilaginibacter sp. X4EP1]|uniref:serine hydrolase domain-containing protein n=1 Tax=Mucilaginibacter sp. X4EP1 TaxID=2723092 RepID=UPI00216739BF|nr:serine hydrolase [Mucilaginibacter sp. X4EP1]MCS3813532.1 CubicO group peptidase (beta-lactamase class C family) [Mucilaginibacter sp. X4EP1]
MKKILALLLLLTAHIATYAQLEEMTKAVQDGSYKGIHSILIFKGGQTVYAQYFNGYAADSLHDSRSSFKSITSLLLGIAIDKGLIKDVNQPVYTFFPEDTAFARDPRKRMMTIKDLLEMRSGFDCDEWTDDGKDCESAMTQTNNWVKFALALPMKNEPGKVWNYTSCDPMIISGIIVKVSGISIMDFAAKYLFTPMGIIHYRWTVDPAGQGMTAGSFYILPTDMLKIGRMVLDDGVWEGKRIVSETWLRASTTATIPIPDNWSFVKFSRSKTAIPQQTYYGYYWYNETVKINNGEYPVVFASGNGGQYIMIIKKLNMVVVFTQGNYESWTAKRAFDILATYIIPAYK